MLAGFVIEAAGPDESQAPAIAPTAAMHATDTLRLRDPPTRPLS